MLSLGRRRSCFSMDTETRILKRIITAGRQWSKLTGFRHFRSQNLPAGAPRNYPNSTEFTAAPEALPARSSVTNASVAFQMANHPGCHPYPLLGVWNTSCAHKQELWIRLNWRQWLGTTVSLAGSAGLRRRRSISGGCHKIKPEYFAIICQSLQETLGFWQCLWSQTKTRTLQS